MLHKQQDNNDDNTKSPSFPNNLKTEGTDLALLSMTKIKMGMVMEMTDQIKSNLDFIDASTKVKVAPPLLPVLEPAPHHNLPKRRRISSLFSSRHEDPHLKTTSLSPPNITTGSLLDQLKMTKLPQQSLRASQKKQEQAPLQDMFSPQTKFDSLLPPIDTLLNLGNSTASGLRDDFERHPKASDPASTGYHEMEGESVKRANRTAIPNTSNTPRPPASENQNNKKTTCEECFKTFGRTSELNRHVASVHRSIKPHVCIICGRGFSQTVDLRRHLRGKHKLQIPMP